MGAQSLDLFGKILVEIHKFIAQILSIFDVLSELRLCWFFDYKYKIKTDHSVCSTPDVHCQMQL